MPAEFESKDLAAAFVVFADIARTNPRVAYIIARSFIQAAEKAAAGKPLTDPNRPEAVDRILDAVAEAFLEALPGLYVREPPSFTPPAAKA